MRTRMALTALVPVLLLLAPADGPAVLRAQQTAAARQPANHRDPLTPAPNRRADEGKGPFKTLAIRGAMLIDGTGAPPRGPVDIIVSGNRISAVRPAGTPGLALRANRQPQAELDLDGTGMYVMPGFVD